MKFSINIVQYQTCFDKKLTNGILTFSDYGIKFINYKLDNGTGGFYDLKRKSFFTFIISKTFQLFAAEQKDRFPTALFSISKHTFLELLNIITLT